MAADYLFDPDVEPTIADIVELLKAVRVTCDQENFNALPVRLQAMFKPAPPSITGALVN